MVCEKPRQHECEFLVKSAPRSVLKSSSMSAVSGIASGWRRSLLKGRVESWKSALVLTGRREVRDMWLLGYAAGIILDSKNGIGFHVDRLPIEAEVNVMMNMLYCRSLHLIINARPGPESSAVCGRDNRLPTRAVCRQRGWNGIFVRYFVARFASPRARLHATETTSHLPSLSLLFLSTRLLISASPRVKRPLYTSASLPC